MPQNNKNFSLKNVKDNNYTVGKTISETAEQMFVQI